MGQVVGRFLGRKTNSGTGIKQEFIRELACFVQRPRRGWATANDARDIDQRRECHNWQSELAAEMTAAA